MNEYDAIRAAFAHNRKDAELLLHETVRGILAEDFPAIRAKVDRLFLGPPTGWPVQIRVGRMRDHRSTGDAKLGTHIR